MGTQAFTKEFKTSFSAGKVPVSEGFDFDGIQTAYIRAGHDLVHAGICPKREGETVSETLADAFALMSRLRGFVQNNADVSENQAFDTVIEYVNDNVDASPTTEALLGWRRGAVQAIEASFDN